MPRKVMPMADGTPNHASAGRAQRIPTILQAEAAECSLACVTMIAKFHGHDVDLPSMRRRFDTSLRGMSLTKLIEVSRAMGLDGRPLKAEVGYLRYARMPCILHWDLNHFVVLNGVSRGKLRIHDPARGFYTLKLDDVSTHFTGVLIEFTPAADFSPVQDRQKVSIRSLTGRISGLKRSLGQIFGLAIAIELLGLLAPFQMQWTIDQVLPSADRGLLTLICAGFLALVAIRAGLMIARGYIISWLGASINSQWVTNLFSHLLRLPLDFFQKRRMGDIVSRFTSLQSIQTTITGSFIEAVLDGLMAVLALCIMLSYSVPMTGVVAAGVGIYIALRFASFRLLRSVTEEQLAYGARQQSELMDTVRGIQAVKIANRQSQRCSRLATATSEASERIMRTQRITLTFNAVSQGLVALQKIALIAVGANLVFNSHFTAGMLVAFIAYADQFGTKFSALVDKCIDFGMMKLHGERVADIALSPAEDPVETSFSGPFPEPSLSIVNAGFRYSDSERWVFRNLSLEVRAGESVAIVGPSGCGKSTLAKLMLGLIAPTEGRVEISGIEINTLGMIRYRLMIGAVMQDDQLFPGSIADNISFFDPGASLDDIVFAATTAVIHQEIMMMPMGYETMVGDMGSAVSGGQKQRILLARALFRKPKILLLDEATSHLDAANEQALNDSIRRMDITRIIIAHRAETIASADRVVNLFDVLEGAALAE